MSAGEATDEALVVRLRQHDRVAFRQLYERYVQTVYTFAAQMLGPADAEDVVQDVFLRLWQQAAQFEEERGPFRSWFMSIARHRILDEFRRRTRRSQAQALAALEQTLRGGAATAGGLEEQVGQQRRETAVWQALQDIPDEQRRVLVLAYFGGLSHTALAQRLGWPLGTVKKRLRLGVQKLRRLLTQHGLRAVPPAPRRQPRGR